MLKVCMITPKAYPVPAVRGGAVEDDKMCLHLHGPYEALPAIGRWFSHDICVSNYVAHTLVMDGRVSPGRVDVLRNGIQAERFAGRDPSYSRAVEKRRWLAGRDSAA